MGSELVLLHRGGGDVDLVPLTSDTLPAWMSRYGHRYLIWKVFLAVAASTRPYRVVAVTSPATARLFYASPAHWGAVSGSQTIGAPPRQPGRALRFMS